uniref:Uncharacterized protein n=1 Tax=Avena sativa TaxID=4498 RepID=A0ACD5V0Z2_AVESA
MELLSAKQVRRMDSIRPEQVGILLRSIAGAAASSVKVNVSDKVMALSNDVVSRAVFGGKFPQQEEYLRNLDEAFVLLGGFCLVDLFPSSRLVRWLSSGERGMKRSYGHVQRINTDVIEGRKAARAAGVCSRADDEDLLDVLLRLQEEDAFAFPLTTESIGAVLFDIFAGATQTTGVALEWAMAELARHPKVMAKAQLEIREVLGKDRGVITNNELVGLHYMRMVAKEVLRLHPPGPLIPRRAREDRKVMGFDMLEGTNVYINAFAISRDPKCWENPKEFMPERFENSNMDYNGTYFEFTPFGAGRRQCPGIFFDTAGIASFGPFLGEWGLLLLLLLLRLLPEEDGAVATAGGGPRDGYYRRRTAWRILAAIATATVAAAAGPVDRRPSFLDGPLLDAIADTVASRRLALQLLPVLCRPVRQGLVHLGGPVVPSPPAGRAPPREKEPEPGSEHH